VELPDYIPVEALARAFKVDLGALRVLNPALRPPIWNGSRFVPRGYELRLPGNPPHAEITAAWERLPPAQRYVAQRNDGTHKVRRGETAATSRSQLYRLLEGEGGVARYIRRRRLSESFAILCDTSNNFSIASIACRPLTSL
jgi:hypothetical protein